MVAPAKKKKKAKDISTSLRIGDTVMVIAGGNKKKRAIKGQTGKIMSFSGKRKERVLIEGINLITKHQAPTQQGGPSGRIQKEAPVHISNVLFYADKAKKPVKLRNKVLDDGRKVRGYLDPKNKEFVQID